MFDSRQGTTSSFDMPSLKYSLSQRVMCMSTLHKLRGRRTELGVCGLEELLAADARHAWSCCGEIASGERGHMGDKRHLNSQTARSQDSTTHVQSSAHPEQGWAQRLRVLDCSILHLFDCSFFATRLMGVIMLEFIMLGLRCGSGSAPSRSDSGLMFGQQQPDQGQFV